MPTMGRKPPGTPFPSDQDFLTDLRRARKRDDVRLVSRCPMVCSTQTLGNFGKDSWIMDENGVLPSNNG